MATDGAILTVQKVKDALNINHTDFDDYISDLVLESEAIFETMATAPITKTSFTERKNGDRSRLFLGNKPLDETSVKVTDLETPDDSTDDTVLTKDDDYMVEPNEGFIIAINNEGNIGRDITFGPGFRRFKIEYDAGLDQLDNWATQHKRMIGNTLRDLVVHLFEDRNPSTRRRQYASGAARSINQDEIPDRILRKWEPYMEALIF